MRTRLCREPARMQKGCHTKIVTLWERYSSQIALRLRINLLSLRVYRVLARMSTFTWSSNEAPFIADSRNQDRLWPRAHHAAEMWQRCFFFPTIRPTVHTDPSQKRSFSKTLFKLDNLKTPALRFSVGEKHFENEVFENRDDDVTINMLFPCATFPQTQI